MDNNALICDGRCISGKRMFDKKGAQTMANTTYELHHIECGIYCCPWCHFWHLTTKRYNKNSKFRHSKRVKY